MHSTTPKIETHINWDEIARRMADADFEPHPDGGGYSRRVWLGTVFNWYPSGKYYLPFACSNVEPCPTCQGHGDLPNPAQDAVIHAAAAQFAQWLVVEIMAAYGPWAGGAWDQLLAEGLNDVRAIQNLSQPEVTCVTCEGCGSEEAYHDDLWREQVEVEADARGYGFEHGENDPCDLFIVEWVSDENLPK